MVSKCGKERSGRETRMRWSGALQVSGLLRACRSALHRLRLTRMSGKNMYDVRWRKKEKTWRRWILHYTTRIPDSTPRTPDRMTQFSVTPFLVMSFRVMPFLMAQFPVVSFPMMSFPVTSFSVKSFPLDVISPWHHFPWRHFPWCHFSVTSFPVTPSSPPPSRDVILGPPPHESTADSPCLFFLFFLFISF